MHPHIWGMLLGLMLVCIVMVTIHNCNEMKENWREKQPPRFLDYFWTVIESVMEFFD